MAIVWAQVHGPLRLRRRRGPQRAESGVHAVPRLHLADDAAVSDGVPVQRALLARAARPRSLLPVWHVRRQLRERPCRPPVSAGHSATAHSQIDMMPPV